MERAREILKEGKATTVDELKNLAKELEGILEYGMARRLLEKATKETPQDIRIRQQLALCTYKDEELLPSVRFSQALKILEELGLCDPNKSDGETLRLAGAIYKRKWEYDGQVENLYQALAFYRAAYERHPEEDKGYGGINAAHILDILAWRARTVARRTGTDSPEGGQLQQQATDFRERMAREVPKLAETNPKNKEDYWFNGIVAEIYYGLDNYPEAGKWLAHARSLNPYEWQRQTTFRQLVRIARLRGRELPREGSGRESWDPAWKVLSELLGEETECALSCHRGKTGLALSGGGFRASFFHLGVLARMAEMDVLRSVEVLSTVSGGSIVGAHYYLELRKLLETKADTLISREDYIEIVKRMQKDFLAGVQENLRTRMLADFKENLKMLFVGGYNMSHRIGELYERRLYSKVKDSHPPDQPRRMNDLFITPMAWPQGKDFKPRFDNWLRRAKVPILLFNAASLNTGHVWHFTASWMGEPPGLVGDEVDKNERCRRLYYRQAPEQHLRDYRLGYAVAASACVPGLFDPLVIDKLYPKRTIRLVDGGVYDNQGVEGLLEEQCRLVLCSDASGQMEDNPKPSGGLLGVLNRSSSIQGDRIREAEYQDLCGRLDTKALQGLFFIHLRKDLQVPPVDWIQCDDSSQEVKPGKAKTPYGVDARLQGKIAGIRTDLDSFSEVEANALMLSGYLMTDHQFQELQKQYLKQEGKGTWGDFDIDAAREDDWPFLPLEPIMSEPETSANPSRHELGRQLDASKHRAFKVWRLDPMLRKLRWALLGVAVVLAVALTKAFWDCKVLDLTLTLNQIVLFLGVVLVGLAFPVWNWINPQRRSFDLARKIIVVILGYLSAKLHLKKFDKRYLEYGSMNRLLNLTEVSDGKGPFMQPLLDAPKRLFNWITKKTTR
jgi:predicted acylesterase/phospholipase RssA